MYSTTFSLKSLFSENSRIISLREIFTSYSTSQQPAMKTANFFSILFVLVISFALCYSVSEEDSFTSQHDTARMLWKNPKSYKSDLKRFNSRPKVKRQTNGNAASGNISPDIALANLTGPKLMKDLFISLLNSTDNSTARQANIISSLNYSPNGKKAAW